METSVRICGYIIISVRSCLHVTSLTTAVTHLLKMLAHEYFICAEDQQHNMKIVTLLLFAIFVFFVMTWNYPDGKVIKIFHTSNFQRMQLAENILKRWWWAWPTVTNRMKKNNYYQKDGDDDMVQIFWQAPKNRLKTRFWWKKSNSTLAMIAINATTVEDENLWWWKGQDDLCYLVM